MTINIKRREERANRCRYLVFTRWVAHLDSVVIARVVHFVLATAIPYLRQKRSVSESNIRRESKLLLATIP